MLSVDLGQGWLVEGLSEPAIAYLRAWLEAAQTESEWLLRRDDQELRQWMEIAYKDAQQLRAKLTEEQEREVDQAVGRRLFELEAAAKAQRGGRT